MQISKVNRGEVVEVSAAGRLDEYWSSHVASNLDETIRQGAHRIWFNMSKVTYLSSAGIGMLVGFYKQLSEIDGSFAITEPSPPVRNVLDMTHLSPLLLWQDGARVTGVDEQQSTRKVESESTCFEVMDTGASEGFRCAVIGDPGMLQRGGYEADQARTVVFKGNRLGLGLGAFGSDFEDCRGRYGEFLAVAGAAAYLPTDGSSIPDYIVSTGSLAPELNVLNAIVCEGEFTAVARFDASANGGTIGLSEIAEAALEIAGTAEAAVAIVAETSGLVGAALRKSPASSGGKPRDRFAHPEIREWISFTGEPAFAGSLCMSGGVAARGRDSRLGSMLRPMTRQTALLGHFHAAACRYRPLKKREMDLSATVKQLVEAQGLQGLLHLLFDPRQAEGAGESQFVRGACWVGPIREVGVTL